MKFVDRVSELREFREIEKLSEKKLFVVAVYGLRRVGKTRLILEFLKERGAYFFVNKSKTSADLLKEFTENLRKKNVLTDLEVVESWDKFFEVLIERKASPVVFDEFQNFLFVEPAVLGIFQKAIDLNEGKPGLFILCGSLLGLMKNLFKNSKEPLYGRVKKGFKLEALSLESCSELGKDLKLSKEELVKFYFLFGGFPKYYVAIEDFALENKTAEEIFDKLLFSKDAPLEDEVNSILSQEFGARSGVYYAILEAIATGNNTISSIAGYLNTTPTSLTRQVKELQDFFELIKLEKPFSGKRGVYRIKHPLMQYWFTQLYKNYSQYVTRNTEFIENVKKNLDSYYGRAFENAAKEFLVTKFGLVNARRQWGKIPNAEKNASTYEIDLIGEKNKGVYLFEFKWSDLSHAQVLSELKKLQEKAFFVQNLPNNLKYGLVAKKILGKNELREKGFAIFDLNDF